MTSPRQNELTMLMATQRTHKNKVIEKWKWAYTELMKMCTCEIPFFKIPCLQLWYYPHLNSLRPSESYVRQQTIIGSYNGLSPGRRQAISWTCDYSLVVSGWTNAGILLIGPLGTNLIESEILFEMYPFSAKKIHLKISSGKCRPLCFGLNMLIFIRLLIFNMAQYLQVPMS